MTFIYICQLRAIDIPYGDKTGRGYGFCSKKPILIPETVLGDNHRQPCKSNEKRWYCIVHRGKVPYECRYQVEKYFSGPKCEIFCLVFASERYTTAC